MFLLEYNREQGFHYNTVLAQEGKFVSPLFSYGWLPVCVIPDAFHHYPELDVLLSKLQEAKASYEKVVNVIVLWVMMTMEQFEPEL